MRSSVYLQDLSVLVTSDLREEEVEIIEDERDLSLVDINAFGDEQVTDDDTDWSACDLSTLRPG